ncbi:MULTISPECIES: 3'(2'),5'-bisphosphate nucleotidase CysQ [Photorhabdus]|uniref:3'(2'),5'-bisphosphate nucleotidase CysQ n=1 Tax=Photorhabdus bodei TaxID=2029681 RepID=A0A329XBE9_9GAMM|nr:MULTISPECIES: 3'(2'),5'-bisphosphate nucleotidase CysQ [Photorhabdus]MCT8342510.1 3'(2'),5'-bisphosphate nucleotidase CysQ [Photorhabdus kleinii]NDK98513.1 3'(2'),5'-bisphosphate nucleotidase CysQ [Photorhabdus bodei]NDL02765.1 3'(2'),5'-bisphosphate nucleotidase CysQ [Photorhabdus bodei]NDL06970.1 3'(2'),5'-bisphosphate nucleotidase CysQ [Photorhabdus bodei]RAW99789.1 3'(2'),5'-bisphosphate nucleotidase CysQ [Photorhabdus sp. S10-54]
MLEQICQLAQEAGAAIMTIYQDEHPLKVDHKQDDSPVTMADIVAHKIIKAGLSRIAPEIPLLSEEELPNWEERRDWKRYWLVDPLDGTKEFINRNGEFTVNIALIDEGVPVMGVIYAPVQDTLYSGQGRQAWKKVCGGQCLPIKIRDANPPMVVVSRSHMDTELEDYLNQLGEHQTVSVGSSLKFCLVAEGKAQLYPRFGPTHIWDTAAGHAIAIAAGAHVTNWKGQTLDYTPRESFLNPGFRVTIF